jgi:hypothetical protein
MTVTEWLTSSDAGAMVKFLRGKVTERKMRLFACAYCRRRMPQYAESRNAILVAERYADGLASKEELVDAWVAASPREVRFYPGGLTARDTARRATSTSAMLSLVLDAMTEGADGVAWTNAEEGASKRQLAAWQAERNAEKEQQATLLREIIGNPFHAIASRADWPSPVVATANALYRGEQCAFALHDSLLEIGESELAEHFESPHHPKGCWALDLILKKT